MKGSAGLHAEGGSGSERGAPAWRVSLGASGSSQKAHGLAALTAAHCRTRRDNVSLCGVKNGCFSADVGQKDCRCRFRRTNVGLRGQNADPLTFRPLRVPSAFWPSHSCGGPEADSRSSSRGSLEELPQARSAGAAKQKAMLDYAVYMAKCVQRQAPPRSPAAGESPGQSPESSLQSTQKVLGVNSGVFFKLGAFSTVENVTVK